MILTFNGFGRRQQNKVDSGGGARLGTCEREHALDVW